MIGVTVTAEQRLHLGSRPDAGWVVGSHAFVPGSVLRGALAAAWIAEQPGGGRPAADPDFVDLFEGSLRYGPLYRHPDALLPLSVFRCKYRPEPACAGVGHDAAFDPDVPDLCPACGRSPLEQSKGDIAEATLVERTQVTMRPGTDVADDGGLFSRQALPAGTVLNGQIIGDHPWLTEQATRQVRLGGRRSTSGLVRLQLDDMPAPGEFNGLDPGRGRLTVRLLSPAILVDDLGRPVWRPDDTRLSTALGVGTRVIREWVRPVAVGGWHAASNLPKPRDLAAAPGSVWVLELDNEPTRDGLLRLWREGLGLRRTEGFGWISLDRWRSPFPAAEPSDRQPAAAGPLDELITDVLAHGLLDLVLDDVRRAAETGNIEVPRTRRYRALTSGARATAQALFALDRPPLREAADRLDAVAREVSW